MNRFTSTAQTVLNSSLLYAREFGHSYIGTEHLLLALINEKNGVAYQLLSDRKISSDIIRDLIIKSSGTGESTNTDARDMTPSCRKIIESSSLLSVKHGQNYIGTEHFLLAISEETTCVAYKLLQSAGLSPKVIYSDILRFLSGFSQTPNLGIKLYGNEIQNERAKEYISALNDAPTLRQYGKDLCEQAKNGKTDPLIGRENELERIVRTLSRRSKNNPCLVGEAGVGKTAIVEGLAKRIVEGKVPDNLVNKSIISIDIPSMIAGAKYRGEFEERMKNVLSDLSKNQNIILFIDEMHIIVGAGAAEGAVDAASILKPALARGGVRLIGATTLDEYRKNIEKDPALERRFQPIVIEEPNHSQSVSIIEGLREKYQRHHNIIISDSAIEAAVTMSERYINDRFLPDKAIDIIDEASAKKHLESYNKFNISTENNRSIKRLNEEAEIAVRHQDFLLATSIRERGKEIKDRQYCNSNILTADKSDYNIDTNGKPILNTEDIAEIVSEWTGIPLGKLNESESKKIIELPSELKESLVGQDKAIEAVCSALRRSRLGISDPNRPMGSFIFAGPTGVGKTQLAKLLAVKLFGSENSLIRFDMSEYMEKYSISKLIGSPPGYIAYEEGGQLSEKIRRKPYSVVLFDEIEKAHPDIFNILLQILEDGKLKDSQGKSVSFKNSIIILTSNIGTGVNVSKLGSVGFNTENEANLNEQRIKEEIKKSFRPELVGRFDDIVVFNSLSKENLNKICKIMLDERRERLLKNDIRLEYDDSVADYLCSKCNGNGARPLRMLIQKEIEDKIALLLLTESNSTHNLYVSLDSNGEIIIKGA